MAETNPLPDRPLSPHLQIYRPQITTVLSILHRITGCGLAFGAVIVTWWLFSVIYGIDAYRTFHAFATSIPGRFMLFCWLWAFCYHALNGVRHLFWDAGVGLNMEKATKSGYTVVGGSVLLSLVIWGLA